MRIAPHAAHLVTLDAHRPRPPTVAGGAPRAGAPRGGAVEVGRAGEGEAARMRIARALRFRGESLRGVAAVAEARAVAAAAGGGIGLRLDLVPPEEVAAVDEVAPHALGELD